MPGGGVVSAMLVAQATGEAANRSAPSRDGLPDFQPAQAFQGARRGMAFKMGDQGLGYYPDPFQTLIASVRPQLPERCRTAHLREVELRVDRRAGAGLSLAHSEYGFAVEGVEVEPGQNLKAGEVIVAIEGRLLVGLSAPQMQASFQKRRTHGALLTVGFLQELSELATRDPNIVECWDGRHQRPYYFHRKTGQTGWTPAELQTEGGAGPSVPEATAPGTAAPPIDLSTFLTHGFNAPKESAPKKKRKQPASNEKDESDLAREEKKRWDDWNAGGKGGYTEQFFQKYRNCTSFPTKPKEDKRLKGSVGPGQGMEYMAAWTGSKNSFN